MIDNSNKNKISEGFTRLSEPMLTKNNWSVIIIDEPNILERQASSYMDILQEDEVGKE